MILGSLSSVLLFVLLLGSSPTWAQRRGGNAQWATVRTDGAMVFSEPSVDADVLAYLRAGDRVAVSRKRNRDFHRVRLEGGQQGYIDARDLASLDEAAPRSSDDGAEEETTSGRPLKKAKSKKSKKSPYYQEKPSKDITESRYMGGQVGFHQVTENFAGSRRSGWQTFFGLKFSAPDLVSFSPFLTDISVMLSTAPPNYYRVDAETASGFAVWADVNMIFPLAETQSFVWYIGAGPIVGFQQYKLMQQRQFNTISNFRFGVNVLTGVGLQLQGFLLRTDLKYLWEKDRYPGLAFSVQKRF